MSRHTSVVRSFIEREYTAKTSANPLVALHTDTLSYERAHAKLVDAVANNDTLLTHVLCATLPLVHTRDGNTSHEQIIATFSDAVDAAPLDTDTFHDDTLDIVGDHIELYEETLRDRDAADVVRSTAFESLKKKYREKKEKKAAEKQAKQEKKAAEKQAKSDKQTRADIERLIGEKQKQLDKTFRLRTDQRRRIQTEIDVLRARLAAL